MIYAILPERRIIRVYHGALDLTGRNHRRDEGDARVREMADLIVHCTDLVKPSRRCQMPWLNAVDFHLAPAHFQKAAVAARIAFRNEANWLKEAAI